jgi:Domain of unknown function (DUF4136)
MTRPSTFAFPFLLCASLFALSAAAQKVNTTFDDQYNFSQHKHYKWRDNRLFTRQNPDTNQVMDIKIVKAVNQLLASKGFVEVQDNPDFFIHYDGGGNANIAAAGAAQAGSGPKTSADIAPDYGMGNGPTLAPGTWLKVNGHFVFHLVDATSHQPIWETTYSKTFHDPNKALDNMHKEVNELVTKSFKDFPPKSKK